MARHHTKDKGDLAVVKVQADLVEHGATVLIPLTEHAPFDLIAYVDELFFRVQVKFRTALPGRCRCLESSWADRHGVHTRPMPRDEVDVVAIHCPETALCYYVDPSRLAVRDTPIRPAWTVRRLECSPPRTSSRCRHQQQRGGSRSTGQATALDVDERGAGLVAVSRGSRE